MEFDVLIRINKEDEVLTSLMKSNIPNEIKKRAFIDVKDNTISIKAKDIKALKAALTSIVRFFELVEDAKSLVR